MARPIAVYRTLLRSINQVFKNDTAALTAARAQIKEKYEESAQVTDPAQVDQLCDEAVDVAGFIRDHVVQAELNERGNYGASHDPLLCTAPGMQLESQHAEIVAEEPDSGSIRAK